MTQVQLVFIFLFPGPQNFPGFFLAILKKIFPNSTIIRNKEKYSLFKEESPYELPYNNSLVFSELLLLPGCSVQSQVTDGLSVLLKDIFKD